MDTNRTHETKNFQVNICARNWINIIQLLI